MRKMKKEISNQKVNKNSPKVWTEYRVFTYYPYYVVVKMNGRTRDKSYMTKLFATMAARKIAKVLGAKPDLRFVPVL